MIYKLFKKESSILSINISRDIDKQNEFLINIVDPLPGQIILDLGCGAGNQIKKICQTTNDIQVYGLDNSDKLLNLAEINFKQEINAGKVHLIKANVTNKLEFNNEFFDTVFSAELLECLPKDKQKMLIEETCRVLKPQGKVIAMHTDWDTQVWHTSNKDLTRKLVNAFCDTKQDWMESFDGHTGQKLWGLFQETKLFNNAKEIVYVLTNNKYEPEFYGYQRSIDMYITTKNKDYSISKNDVDIFIKDLEIQEKLGRYFYSVNRYIYIAQKY